MLALTEVAAAVACPLCGAEGGERLSEHLREPMGELFEMRPHQCGDCDLVFLHPYFSADELDSFYRESYRELYHGASYDLEAFHVARLTDARRRRNTLVRGGLLRGDVLDVGCSTGAFLGEARAHARDLVGVEPDEAQRAFAQELGLHAVASLDGVDRGSFDLITLFHVLEHLLDPVETLRDLASKLTPRGAIVVEVPNVDDALLSRHRVPEYERFYWHPAHHFYFSRVTLHALAHRAGLRARIEPVQRYPLANHLNWAIRGEPGSGEWLADSLSREDERAYVAELRRTFTCDTLWMVARPQ